MGRLDIPFRPRQGFASTRLAQLIRKRRAEIAALIAALEAEDELLRARLEHALGQKRPAYRLS